MSARAVAAAFRAVALVVCLAAGAGAPEGPRFVGASEFAELRGDPRMSGFFASLRPLETALRLGMSRPSACHESAVRDYEAAYFASAREFTSEERFAVAGLVEKIRAATADLDCDGSETWSFVKLDDAAEGGLPHTVCGHIALPAKIVASMAGPHSGADGAVFVVESARLLAHERLHVLQRRRPERFDAMYAAAWGLRRVDRSAAAGPREPRRVTNPDAFESDWVFPLAGSPSGGVLPLLVLRPGASLSLRSRIERVCVPWNGADEPGSAAPEGDAALSAAAGRAVQGAAPDHPHEMSACLFADEVVRRISAGSASLPPPPPAGTTERFVAWCRREMSGRTGL